MNSNTATEVRLPQVVGQTLNRYRRRWRVLRSASGLFIALAAVAAGVGLAVGADRLLRLSSQARWVCLIGLAGAFLALLAARVFWPVIRRLTNLDAAVRLGGKFPAVKEDLVTAVELTGHKVDAGISRSLIVRALDQISGRARSINPRSAVPLRPLLLAAVLFLALGGTLGLAYQIRPDAVRNAMARLFQPNRDVPYYCYTHVTVTSGDPVVAAGDSAKVTAEVTGRVPAVATLELQGKNGLSSTELAIAAGGTGGQAASGTLSASATNAAGLVSWQSGPLFDDLRYRVRAGDDLGEWHRIRVVPAPSVQSKAVLVKYPDYTGGDGKPGEGMEKPFDPMPGLLEVVEGSAVQIRIRPVNRGGDSEFACTGELVNGSPLAPGESPGANADGSLRSGWLKPPPAATTEYAIKLVDGFGLASKTPDSVIIRTVPDRKPTVSIARPGGDVILLPGEAVTVEAAASDDFGLRGLTLLTRAGRRIDLDGHAPSRPVADGRDGGRPSTAGPGDDNPAPADDRPAPWQSRQLKAGGRAVRELSESAVLNVSDLGLTPGDVLEYKAAAADFAGDPFVRTTESAVYRILVIGETEHLARTLNKLKDVQLELLRLAARQNLEAAGAGKLAEKAATTQAEPINAEARDAQERQKDLARADENIARQVESLTGEMARNPAASPAVLAKMEQLGRAVRSVAEQPMTGAAAKEGQAADNDNLKPADKKKPEQAAAMKDAQALGEEAAQRLEELAESVDKMAAAGQLDRLATAAELLAARQQNLKEATKPVAVKTAGTPKNELPADLNNAVDNLAANEDSIKSDVDALAKELAKTAANLADSNPAGAAKADQAGGQMESDKMSDQAADIASSMKRNVLFNKLPEQDELARKLAELAKKLRADPKEDAGEQVIKEIDKFLARQTKINSDTRGAIGRKRDLKAASALGEAQADLARDVTEQAAALRMLAEEIEGFESMTAVQLLLAAGEMRPGARDLYDARLPEGLEHGRKAAALLQEARKEAEQEKGDIDQGSKNSASMASLLLMQRILNAQKQVNEDTAKADRIRAQQEAFNRQSADLARRQTAVKLDADRLAGMLTDQPDAADMVNAAGGKMETSRLALAAGDTSEPTRVVQRQIIAMLEAMLKQQKPNGGGGKSASGKLEQARIQALMRMMAMMQQPGATGGGYSGGSNGPVMPSSLGQVGNQDWLRTRTPFEEQLGAGYDADFPAEYKDLLNAYFDRLRKEVDRH